MSVAFNGKSREELELQVSEKLDINVDRLREAELSEARLQQIFNQASRQSRNAKIVFGTWAALAAGSAVALTAGLMTGSGALMIGGAGGLALIFSSSVVVRDRVKPVVEAEIEKKCAERAATLKAPDP